jgi:hypothetical protein
MSLFKKKAKAKAEKAKEPVVEAPKVIEPVIAYTIPPNGLYKSVEDAQKAERIHAINKLSEKCFP